MNVIPFIHEGLGNSSYLIGLDGGSAILVDPDRSVQRYLDAAAARGWRIDSVLETHLHADFVSGAHELAAGVGARLFVPKDERLRLPHHGVQSSERWTLDGLEIASVASPGHTPEHMSYVIRAGSHPAALFSGGSLIVGGAARTDLIAPDKTEQLTRAQYRTLTAAYTELPDDTLLYPTHGGGSFCSAGQGGERTSTLGVERATNPLLAIDDEGEFARWFPTTFPATPAYYWRMRAFNQAGPRLRRDIAMPQTLPPTELAAFPQDAIVVDVRPVAEYMQAHVRGSLSIAFRDAYAVWLGWIVPADAALILVAGDVPIDRIVDESLLVGYERFHGVLAGDLERWERAGLPTASATLASPAAAQRALVDGAAALDVRELEEYRAGHIEGAVHMPLGQLAARAGQLPRDRPIITYCGHGERASTAVSILERAGILSLTNLDGGIEAWRGAGHRVAT